MAGLNWGNVWGAVGDGLTKTVESGFNKVIRDNFGGGEYHEGNRLGGVPQAAAPQTPPSGVVSPNVQANKTTQQTGVGDIATIAKSDTAKYIAIGVASLVGLVVLLKVL